MSEARQINYGVGEILRGSTPAFNNTVIDSFSSLDAVASAWQFDNSGGTITHLGYRYGVRTGTPVQHRISLQGLDASGLPDGTIKTSGTNKSDFTPPADATWNSTFQWFALDASYTPSAGEFLAVVVEPLAEPTPATHQSSWTTSCDGLNTSVSGIPYSLIKTNGGAWTKGTSGGPVFGAKNGGTPTLVWGYPIKDFTSETFSSTVQKALKFKIPASIATSVKLRKIRYQGSLGLTAKTIVFQLLDTTPAALSPDGTISVDSDFISSNATLKVSQFYMGAQPTLSVDTDYYMSIQPGASSSLGWYYIEVANAEDLLAFPGGTSFIYASRATGGATAFTDTATKRPCMELYFDDVTAPSGSGGLMTHPGMLGGMRG